MGLASHQLLATEWLLQLAGAVGLQLAFLQE